MKLTSPWLEFSHKNWPILNHDLTTDVIIVGGGISGVISLYYLLQYTDKKITLVEKNYIASDATGHNAAMAIAVFETPILQLIATHGEEKVQQALADLNQSWDLLFELLQQIGQSEAITLFEQPKLGFDSISNLIMRLEDDQAKQSLGYPAWAFYLSDDIASSIPEKYHRQIHFIPKQKILDFLGTSDANYIAYTTIDELKIGRINTAKLCQDVLIYLAQKFPKRFSVFEYTNIQQINLYADHCQLQYQQGIITAQQTILCTNAYKNFAIIDQEKQLPLTKLQKQISAVEGFMAGYVNNNNTSTMTAAFFNNNPVYANIFLFYLNRAPIPNDRNQGLTIIGGPECELGDSLLTTHAAQQILQHASEQYQLFLRQMQAMAAPPQFDYLWHGTMAYTSNNLRWVGRDREHANLIYNLGCNGIGVLPAIMSGKRIAAILNNELLPASLFDPL